MEKLKINCFKFKSFSKSKKVYFSRNELSLILSTYSKYVAKGIWRDYSLDLKDDFVLFSFYKHAYEQPIYSIEKRIIRTKKNVSFELKKRNKKLYSSKNLVKIINKLNLLPKLVSI